MAGWTGWRDRLGSLLGGSSPTPVVAGPLPSPAPGTPPATRTTRGEWAGLPPLQRRLADPFGPVAPLAEFSAGLAAHQHIARLAPLTHRVDPGILGGVGEGVVRASPVTRTPGDDLVVRVQRTVGPGTAPLRLEPDTADAFAVVPLEAPRTVEPSVPDEPPEVWLPLDSTAELPDPGPVLHESPAPAESGSPDAPPLLSTPLTTAPATPPASRGSVAEVQRTRVDGPGVRPPDPAATTARSVPTEEAVRLDPPRPARAPASAGPAVVQRELAVVPFPVPSARPAVVSPEPAELPEPSNRASTRPLVGSEPVVTSLDQPGPAEAPAVQTLAVPPVGAAAAAVVTGATAARQERGPTSDVAGPHPLSIVSEPAPLPETSIPEEPATSGEPPTPTAAADGPPDLVPLDPSADVVAPDLVVARSAVREAQRLEPVGDPAPEPNDPTPGPEAPLSGFAAASAQVAGAGASRDDDPVADAGPPEPTPGRAALVVPPAVPGAVGVAPVVARELDGRPVVDGVTRPATAARTTPEQGLLAPTAPGSRPVVLRSVTSHGPAADRPAAATAWASAGLVGSRPLTLQCRADPRTPTPAPPVPAVVFDTPSAVPGTGSRGGRSRDRDVASPVLLRSVASGASAPGAASAPSGVIGRPTDPGGPSLPAWSEAPPPYAPRVPDAVTLVPVARELDHLDARTAAPADLVPTVARSVGWSTLPTAPTATQTPTQTRTPTFGSSPSAPSAWPTGNATGGVPGRVASFATLFGGQHDAAGFTELPLQRAEAAEPVASPPPSEPEPAPAPAPAAAAPAPAGPAGSPPTDLDEMARRLFDPLSARLRAELWLDRERAGLMLDAY